MEHTVGSPISAKGYFEKALVISKELGNRKLEADGCLTLGNFFYMRAEYVRPEENIKKALTLNEEQFYSLKMMAQLRMRDGKIQEAISYLLSCIGICEKMRDSLYDHDQFKISFSDCNILSYMHLRFLLCEIIF